MLFRPKKWLFWKTLKLCSTWLDVDNFFIEMKKVDDFNSKTKSLNKIVYNGWAVRNVYEHTGIGGFLNFFESYPTKCKSNCKSEMIWKGTSDGGPSTMEIRAKKLFGQECLEPMKVRITIEKMEE